MLQLSFKDINKAPVWLVETQYAIGSDQGSDIYLDHPSIMAHHADLIVEGEKLSLVPVKSGGSIKVNGATITAAQALAHGNVIELGDLNLEILDPKLSRQQKVDESAPTKVNGWYLKTETTALANKNFDITAPFIVGRAKDCDICLAVSHLSRKHALLTPSETGIEVEDLDSSNGTYVNGVRVNKSLASLGDEIRFDTLSFKVCYNGEAPVQQDDYDADVTSLRPALLAKDIEKAAKAPVGQAITGERQSQTPPLKSTRKAAPRPSTDSIAAVEAKIKAGNSDDLSGGNSGIQVVIGIALVSVLMMALVFYLIS